MTRRSRFIVISLVLVAVLGGVLLLRSKPAQAPAVSASNGGHASLTAELVQPKQATWALTLSASGPLSAWQESVISTEVGGLQIVALHVDVGSRVKRGQVLAELSSATLNADVRQAEANVAIAKASLREAQANARRGQAVRTSGALSAQQIEQYEITEQSAAASLAAAEATLSSARIKLGQTRIVASDGGVISARTATLGAVVNAGSELFRLVRGERVEWRAEVDAQQLAQLHAGQSATVTLPGGSQVNGIVRQLSPTLSSETRTAIAYVDLPVRPEVRAGMYAQGSIALGQRPALTLPSSAVTLRDGRSYVFVWDAARKIVLQREVCTGRSRDGQIEITQGLTAQSSVVARGGAFLNDGDSVRIVTTKEGV